MIINDMSRIRLLMGRVLFLLLACLLVQPLAAATRTYEKPSAFLQRHFGEMPETKLLKLTDSDQQALKKILGRGYGAQQVRYWQVGDKSAWILNEVGKTQPITVGVLVSKGKIAEIKVLIYRESHGWEVSRPFFTKQFVGASLDENKLNVQVDGVVGATLSVSAMKKMGTVALYFDQQLRK